LGFPGKGGDVGVANLRETAAVFDLGEEEAGGGEPAENEEEEEIGWEAAPEDADAG